MSVYRLLLWKDSEQVAQVRVGVRVSEQVRARVRLGAGVRVSVGQPLPVLV